MAIYKSIIAVLAMFCAATIGADARSTLPSDNLEQIEMSTRTLTEAGDSSGSACSEEALEIVRLVNEYREQNGKPAIPVSNSMCITADAHIKDSIAIGYERGAQCNMHSWLDCCYTADHSNLACITSKPSQLTCYTGKGYENSYWGPGGTPAQIVQGWKESGGHNNMMLNIGGWEWLEWKAIGAGVGGGFAHLWVGDKPDCQ